MAGRKNQEVDVLYEDQDICVCRKPTGLPCESKKVSQPDIVKVLKKRYFLQHPDNGEPKVFLVHRLDQPVGGLIVLAKNQKAAASLGTQIAGHIFEKEYLAVVMSGQAVGQKEGQFLDYLCRDGKSNTSRVASAQEKQAKKAMLAYRVLGQVQTGGGYEALVRIKLFTGRHHQIRVQMAAHDMPLLFDKKYNPAYTGKAADSTALYAFHLIFRHPSDGRRMEFTDLPDREPFEGWRRFFPEIQKNADISWKI